MKQISLLKAEMSLLTVVLSISNSESSFRLQLSGNAFSLPVLLRQLHSKLFKVVANPNPEIFFKLQETITCDLLLSKLKD